ncbi:MAG: cobalamin-binding protein [Deltaproteobacteria bacterium]|nr:cobalamin-binding protein [Deltaproteobacteria bacterium]
MRIVSLLPSATEIVCALGAAADLVGISHECDHPPDIRDRTVLTRSRIHDGSSAAIDAAVRDVIANALSIYAVDDAALARLAPDVIITQDLCAVCAVSLDDVRAAVARLAHRTDLRVVALSPTRLADVLDDLHRVGDAISRRAAATAGRAALDTRIAAISRRAAASSARPRVVTLEWIDPLMIGGTWMPELVELAHGLPVGAVAGAPAPTITSAALTALAPDVVLLKPCGFSLPRTLSELPTISRTVLAAVPPTTRVYATDGNAYFNRPGPRLVDSLEILAACLHPDLFADFATHHAASIHRLA